jgi:hypothetical protein
MTRLMLAVLLTAFAIGPAAAQAPGTCESRAVWKDGKALHGAAKNSFVAKCKREACAPKAVGSDGKPLKGAAKEQLHGEMPERTSLTRAANLGHGGTSSA